MVAELQICMFRKTQDPALMAFQHDRRVYSLFHFGVLLLKYFCHAVIHDANVRPDFSEACFHVSPKAGDFFFQTVKSRFHIVKALVYVPESLIHLVKALPLTLHCFCEPRYLF